MIEGNRGFALLGALWLIVALAVVSLELGLRARELRLGAANALVAVRARAAADAGLEHAHGRLQERLLREGLHPDVDPWANADLLLVDTVALGDARYAVSLRGAGTALHLNRANEEELHRFFLALRVDAGRADRIAQSIMDWRDADRLHRARGAEREHYLRSGSSTLPADGPFQTISELRHVNGMTQEIFSTARPHLTLLGEGRINLNAAGAPVLKALPGMTDEAVAVLLRMRRQGTRLAGVQDLAVELSSGARAVMLDNYPRLLQTSTFETREVEVRSEGWLAGNRFRASVEGLLVRGGDGVFLVWRRAS